MTNFDYKLCYSPCNIPPKEAYGSVPDVNIHIKACARHSSVYITHLHCYCFAWIWTVVLFLVGLNSSEDCFLMQSQPTLYRYWTIHMQCRLVMRRNLWIYELVETKVGYVDIHIFWVRQLWPRLFWTMLPIWGNSCDTSIRLPLLTLWVDSYNGLTTNEMVVDILITDDMCSPTLDASCDWKWSLQKSLTIFLVFMSIP